MSSALLEERKAAIRRWTLLIFKIVLPLVALLCTIKNVKNTHGRVLFLVKLQALLFPLKSSENGKFSDDFRGNGRTYDFNKNKTHPWVFFMFLNCKNGTKSRNASQK